MRFNCTLHLNHEKDVTPEVLVLSGEIWAVCIDGLSVLLNRAQIVKLRDVLTQAVEKHAPQVKEHFA